MKRDVDAAQRAVTITALAYSVPGAFVGAVCGLYGAYVGRWGVVVGLVVGVLAGFLVAFGVATLLTGVAGSLARAVLLPSGNSTPAVQQYSYGDSLAARGQYEAAIAAYRASCTQYPEDPEPYIRIARLYRDELGLYEEALFWFRRARADSTVSRGREQLIGQEMIEIFTHRIGEPARAIPELARLVDRFAGDPISQWAREEIVRLRRDEEAAEDGSAL